MSLIKVCSCSLLRQVRISYPLPAGKRVRVSLAAREIRRKFDYSATLLAHYDDGAILTRPIRGRFQVTTLDNFAPIYSREVSLSEAAAAAEEEEERRKAAKTTAPTTTTTTTTVATR